MTSIQAFFDTDTSTVTYLVWDPATQKAAIIDPVLDYEPHAARLNTTSADTVLAAAKEKSLEIEWVLETHAHADHLSAADYIRAKTGARVGIGEHITKVQKIFVPIFGADDVAPDGHVFDKLFADGETFEIGSMKIEVSHTPGHTPACISYLIEDAVFVGDTLFMPDYGTARADFPGGDAATLYQSIQKILSLPANTRVFVGHDYLPEGRDKPAWETTVAQQRESNRHVRQGVSETEFVERRNARDATLAAPRLILPSLQVNIRAGAMPPKAENGETYLKIPVNRL